MGLRTLTLVVSDSIEDSKWGENKKLTAITKNIQLVVDKGWMRRWKGNIRPPMVNVEVINGMRAHFLGIDQIEWGMGGTRERELCGR